MAVRKEREGRGVVGRPKRRWGRKRVTVMKARREAMGLSIREVGRRVGLSNPFVSQIENGRTEPSMRNGIRLAKFFGVKAEELLETAKE
jgi:transcriptional regulator with XRE-family HTH domain